MDSLGDVVWLKSLISLSPDELSSLLGAYKVDEMMEKYDEAMQSVLIAIENESSSEELANCLNYIREYMESEGDMPLRDFDKLNITSNLLRRYTMAALAAYDELHFYFEQFVDTRGTYEYCLHQLEREMAESFVSGIAVDAVIELLTLCPGVGVLTALLDAGYDLVSSLKMAENFNKCLN